MGTFSIFHWLFVLAFPLGVLLALIIPIGTVSRNMRISRKEFAVRFVGVVAALIAIELLSLSLPLEHVSAVDIVATLAEILIIGLFVRWSAGRAQDAGWSKWWCLIYIVPFLNLLFIAALLFKPPGMEPAVLAADVGQGAQPE